MLTRNSHKNDNHCIRCKSVYTPDRNVSADEYPYCNSCNYHRTKAGIRLMNEVDQTNERQAGKRHRQKKVKQYRPCYIPQIT